MEQKEKELGKEMEKRLSQASATLWNWCLRIKQDVRGQGTTEYAILVGVLVVIAIVAVIAFKDNLEQLWQSISDSINQL